MLPIHWSQMNNINQFKTGPPQMAVFKLFGLFLLSTRESVMYLREQEGLIHIGKSIPRSPENQTN